MEWLQATTLQELKKYGKFREILRQVKDCFGNQVTVKAKSWNDLFSAIQELNKFLNKAQEKSSQKVTQLKEPNSTSLYFHSEVARIIYALIRLDGEQRLRELGISKAHTKDMEKAKNWRNNIAKKIHPDVCQHPEAAEASTKLTELYNQMTGQ